MKRYLTPRSVALLAALGAVIALACWILRPHDDLAHLKRTIEVTDGTEDAVAAVRRIIHTAESPDARRKLAKYMYVRDSTEQERITAPLLERPELGEVVILGCSKLAVSHSDNLVVHVYSANRKRSYAFCFIRDKNGVRKLSDIGLSRRKP